MEQPKYFLGLDVGTNSVGWCVTDRDYHIIRKQGKHLWGSRLFDAAQSTAKQRTNREARRRLERRRWRILMLQDIFKTEMDKVDPNFFDRLNNSALHKEDKPANCREPMLLFNNKGMTDREFYKNYPTMYHLRQDMMNHPEKKFDIRAIYLAMAHMIKYRGNFLREGEIKSVETDTAYIIDRFNRLDELLEQIVNNDTEENSEESRDPVTKFECSEEIALKLIALFQKENSKSILKEQEGLFFHFSYNKKDIRCRLLDAINVSSVSVGGLFPEISESDEELGKIKIDFSSEDFIDTTLPSLADSLSTEEFEMVNVAKEIYDFRILANLLHGEKTLSNAMVTIYNAHHEQLATLKTLFKKYAPKEYANFFRHLYNKDGEPNVGSYSSYIGYNKVKAKTECGAHKTSLDDLYKTIRADLTDKLNDSSFAWQSEADKEAVKEINDLMDNDKYLLRQNSSKNGVIPYQFNENEMTKIIDNQKAYYPFLGEMDTDFSNPEEKCYKILSLLKFKIPYYVGPLSHREGDMKPKNQWVVRDCDIKITPWNFFKIVDVEKTEAAFINRMKNFCTYLIGEETLPKNSLLYSEFQVLNEMNNWQINGAPITEDDKKDLIANVYLKQKKVSLTAIKKELKFEHKTDDVSLMTKTGELSDEDIHANLAPFIDMMNSQGFGPGILHAPTPHDLTEKIIDPAIYDLAEKIIYDITMFEDRKVIAKRLANPKYKLSPEQQKYFAGLPYSGWGNLSRKLLDGITVDIGDACGEAIPHSIIDLMWQSPQNFMEIYESADKYPFKNIVEGMNEKQNPSIDDFIDEGYASPAMKRAMRQTFRIIDELKKILKIDSFDSYFVETTRTNDPNKKGKRPKSRQHQLQEVYKVAKKLVTEEAEKHLGEVTDDQLRRKKLFLYFMQCGKSVYTGKPIPLDDLDSRYDIDHIIPQAKVKDDSFTNTVLVEKELNNKKQDNYPIPAGIITPEGKNLIDKLSEIKAPKKRYSYFMPVAKRSRLLRSVSQPLTEEEEFGFINRQLTMTDQAVKGICDVLKLTEPKAKIVYSKASVVSDFRKMFSLTKCRNLNDFHHANDAYLNIVVGNVYNKVFTSNFTQKLFISRKEHFEGTKLDAKDFFRSDQHIFNSDTCIWRAPHFTQDDQGNYVEEETPSSTITLVRKNLSLNDPLVTQMETTQTGKQGLFNKISIHSATNEKGDLFPLKAASPFNDDGWKKKYGGYADMISPYYMLVRSDGKEGLSEYSLETIPTVFLLPMQKKTKDKMDEDKKAYLIKKLGLKNPEIILPKLLIRTVLKVPGITDDGKKAYSLLGITSRSADRIKTINLSELHLPEKYALLDKTIANILGLNLPANGKKDLDFIKQNTDGTVVDGKNIITKQECWDFFDYICNDVFTRRCYCVMPGVSSSYAAIKKASDAFRALPTVKEMITLDSMLQLLCCKPNEQVSLEYIGLGQSLGGKRINKKLSAGTQIFEVSRTGFYQHILFTIPEPVKKS
jgi:CRISPR-associated endonuclease Csn1